MDGNTMHQFEGIESKIYEDFTANLNFSHSNDEIHVEDGENEIQKDDEENKVADDDFSFAFNADEMIDPDVRPVFPLFDLDLLSDYDSDSSVEHSRLPHHPSVKLFVRSSNLSSSSSSSSSGSDEVEGVAAGPYCVWKKKGKDKKSNSTGFSKLWRFRDLVKRSNSDGRDAFVFLNNSTAAPKREEKKSEKLPAAGESWMKKKALGSGEIVKKTEKVKKAPMSAHEIYMKSRGSSEDRRRTYLPYRPELVGFFTNVNGALSKNVHPY